DPGEERACRAAAYPDEPAPWHTRRAAASASAADSSGNGRMSLPLLRRIARRATHDGRRPATEAPGHPLDAHDPLAPLPREDDHRGQTERIAAERRGATWFTPLDPTWAPLTNDVAPDPIGPGAGRYAARRLAMLEALSACDGALAVSSHVRARYEALGVPREKLRTLHIGTVAGAIAA